MNCLDTIAGRGIVFVILVASGGSKSMGICDREVPSKRSTPTASHHS